MNGLTISISEQLVEAVALRVAALLGPTLKAQPQDQQELRRGWVDKRGAAEYTSLGVSTIAKLTTANEIPHRHVGGRVVYRLAELDAWLADR